MASPTIQFKRGLALNLPSLRAGEPGFATDRSDFYVGLNSTTQGNKFFGSSRYWVREDGTNSLKLNLVDKSGNNGVRLAAPNTLAGVTTYTFPATPTAGYFLKTDVNGNLSWDTVSASATFENATLTGVTTITSVTLQGGSINGTTVGLTTAAAAAFTTLGAGSLNVSGISTFNGAVNLGDTSGDIITVNGTATFNQSITGTISTATRATQVDTTATTTNATYYVPFVSNSGSTSSEIIRIDGGLQYNPSTNAVTADIVKGNTEIRTPAVKYTDGTAAVTIDAGGNVGVTTNLTVSGDLYVNGTTTQVNTISLTVEDTLVELGMVDGNAPGTDLNKDLGLLLNYFSGTAKKAAAYWDDSVSRFAIASEVSEASSVLTAAAYAALEVSSLYINNACTGGVQEVIGCADGQLTLSNIVVDGGSF